MKSIKVMLMLMFFATSMAYAGYENHGGSCHDKASNPIKGCKQCDAMPLELCD